MQAGCGPGEPGHPSSTTITLVSLTLLGRTSVSLDADMTLLSISSLEDGGTELSDLDQVAFFRRSE